MVWNKKALSISKRGRWTAVLNISRQLRSVVTGARWLQKLQGKVTESCKSSDVTAFSAFVSVNLFLVLWVGR